MFLTANDVKFMFNEMIQRSEQLFLSGDVDSAGGGGGALEDRLINLPSFLEALASIVQQLDQVTCLSSRLDVFTCSCLCKCAYVQVNVFMCAGRLAHII